METQEFVNVLGNCIPEADIPIVLAIARRTIQVLQLPPAITEAEWDQLTPEQRYREMMTPQLAEAKLNDEVSCFFLRFVGDETPLANVLFFPIEATYSFLVTARNYYSQIDLTDEDREKLVFEKSINMLCLMLRNLPRRVRTTMTFVTEETINEWYRQEHEIYREGMARMGQPVPNLEPKIQGARRDILLSYRSEVGAVWKEEKRRWERYQKTRLAEEYDKLLPHWSVLSLLFRRKGDWRAYAKIEGFEDTPDDLLDDLKGSHHRGISLKALEHAARRVHLINPDSTDEKVLSRRSAGFFATGFADSVLYKYLDEGRELIAAGRAHEVHSSESENSEE